MSDPTSPHNPGHPTPTSSVNTDGTLLGQVGSGTIHSQATSVYDGDAGELPEHLKDHPRYQVIRKLGQGGMGAVYLAEHKRMERLVALKVIGGGIVADDKAIQRFHQEVKAASRLSHPQIVTAFDADESGEGASKTHFLVMEYVEGESLADYLKRLGPLPVDEGCRYTRDAALGLQNAFEHGMVHRDIKPHNLIRSKKGAIKILDFGLARLTRQAESDEPVTQLTGAGFIMGTVDYMAPEQAGDAHSADIRADIYSLGCTLYQLLSGQVPFPTGTTATRLVKHATETPRPLRELRPEIPEPLSSIVAKMLAKKTEDRFQTPAEVAQALQPFIEDADVRKAPPPTAGSGKGPAKGTWIAVALLATAALVALAIWIYPQKKPQTIVAPVTSVIPSPTPAVVAQTPVPAPPDARNDAEVPDAPVTSGNYLEIHGANIDALKKWFGSLQAKGMRPEFISARAGSETPIFDAVAVAAQGKAFEYYFKQGIDPVGRLDAKNNSCFARCVCFYLENGTIESLTISQFAKIRHGRGMTGPLASVVAMLKTREGHRRPGTISLIGSPQGGEVRMNYQAEPKSDVQWEFQYNLDAGNLRKLESDWRARKRMPELLSIYIVGDVPRFAVTEIENTSSTEWKMVVDIPDGEFEKLLKDQIKNGLRPTAMASRATKTGALYTAFFVRVSAAAK